MLNFPFQIFKSSWHIFVFFSPWYIFQPSFPIFSIDHEYVLCFIFHLFIMPYPFASSIYFLHPLPISYNLLYIIQFLFLIFHFLLQTLATQLCVRPCPGPVQALSRPPQAERTLVDHKHPVSRHFSYTLIAMLCYAMCKFLYTFRKHFPTMFWSEKLRFLKTKTSYKFFQIHINWITWKLLTIWSSQL